MSQDGRQKILCIEDNPVNWRLVQRLLTQAGYDMCWAEEGLKGYEMALSIKPDLVLLDINLPGLSGFEIATKFRSNTELQGMKIVALTAKILKADRETALVAGCDGFIPKPIDPFTFVDQVSSYLGGKKDRIEQGREGAVLRGFNAQVLEHLESQLNEAQETNRKLMETQSALEARNRSLSRLLFLSQSIVGIHDPSALMRQIMEEVLREFHPVHFSAYRLHRSQGYLEGMRLRGDTFEETPTLSHDHSFILRLQASLQTGLAIAGDKLRSSRVYDEGIALGLWDIGSEPCLILLKDRQNHNGIWGFWTLARPRESSWLPFEQEVLTLLSSIALTDVENAELIASLNESSRALASSYEQMENAYQDLQKAKEDLMRRDRQMLLEDLFLKIGRRLQAPVLVLNDQVRNLDGLISTQTGACIPRRKAWTESLGEIREAVVKIDGLLRALMRRVQKNDSDVPEWVDLQDLIVQEMELLHAECGIPPEVVVQMDLKADETMIFGVYGDFAKMLLHVITHVLMSPQALEHLLISTWKEADVFHLSVRDDAGVIPPSELIQAFEPFSSLHNPVVIGVRVPGPGLALAKQMLASYHGDIEMMNEEEGTTVHLFIPLH
jgi:CheY-like chemotaxis protein